MLKISLAGMILLVVLLLLLPAISTISATSNAGKLLLTPILNDKILSNINEYSASYDWAVGGYSTQTCHNSYTAVWHSGFNISKKSNCTISYMLNVPVSISGYLNVSLYFPGICTSSLSPIQIQFSWMWIQDAVEMLQNGSVIPVLNIWFICGYPPMYAVIYVIYGGMNLTHNGPYNETVYYSNGGWNVVLNGVTIAKVSNNKVTDCLSSSQEIIATYFFGLLWPWTYVSAINLNITSVSTEVYTVLPSAGIEVHTGYQYQFVENNPHFTTLFNFYVDGKSSDLYYAKSVNISEDYGFMAGSYPPPNCIYGGSVGGKYLVIGTQNGIASIAQRLGLSFHITDITNTSFY